MVDNKAEYNKRMFVKLTAEEEVRRVVNQLTRLIPGSERYNKKIDELNAARANFKMASDRLKEL